MFSFIYALFRWDDGGDVVELIRILSVYYIVSKELCGLHFPELIVLKYVNGVSNPIENI